MIKVNSADKIHLYDESAWDQDTSDLYDLAEISAGSAVFHVTVVFGAAGCCDNGCNMTNRFITTEVEKAVCVASQNTVLESQIGAQFPDCMDRIVSVKSIQKGVGDTGQITYLFFTDDMESIVFPKSTISKSTDLTTIYCSGKQAYWKD